MQNHARMPALLSFPLAALLAVCSFGAIFVPAVYAREHPYWAAQGRGQDWVDLLLVVPLLAISAYGTLSGSRRATLLLAGTLAYTMYSLTLYAFFLHFGPLFLAYAWAFGLCFYALVGILFALRAHGVSSWFDSGAPVRLAAAFTVLPGVLFYLLWMSEVVPAMRAGTMPKSALDVALITNPVHVLDLGVVLPAFVIAGIALARRRPLGYWMAPTMLGFGAIMDAALTGMVISVRASGIDAGGPPAAMFAAMTIVTVVVLLMLLGHVRRPDHARS